MYCVCVFGGEQNLSFVLATLLRCTCLYLFHILREACKLCQEKIYLCIENRSKSARNGAAAAAIFQLLLQT